MSSSPNICRDVHLTVSQRRARARQASAMEVSYLQGSGKREGKGGDVWSSWVEVHSLRLD